MYKTSYVSHEAVRAVGSPDGMEMEIEIPKSFTAPQLRGIAAALSEAVDKLEQKDGAWVEGETTIAVARPAAKPRFKVGDRVKIKTTGVNAVVTGFGSYGYYEVKPPSGNALYMHSDDLEPAPEPAPDTDAGPEAEFTDFATWDAHFSLYVALNYARRIDPIKLAKDAAQYATAAVDARRKMEQQP